MNARAVFLGVWVVLAGCPSPSAPDAATDAGSEPLPQLALTLDDANLELGIGLEAEVLTRTVRLRNTGTGAVTLGPATLVSGDARLELEVFAGTRLESGQTSDVTASIRLPQSGGLRRFQAQFQLTTVEGISVTLDVTARSTPAFLSWSPAMLDFEFSPPTVPVIREVEFSNVSLQPVLLTQLAAREGAGASTTFAPLVTSLTVPAATLSASAPNGILPGRATLQVRFTPVVLGPRTGELRAMTSVATQLALAIPLRGQGGGPVIDVQPFPVLDLGRVAYFANSSPASFVSRSLVVQNVGTRPFPADSRGNLHLGNAQGVFWEVTAEAGSSVSEICVGDVDAQGVCLSTLAAYDAQVGLLAGASETLQIPIRVTPGGLGQRRFTVRIFSNDRRTPEKVVAVIVNAVNLPPCDVEVTPIALDFGMLAAPVTRELAVTIRNRHTGPNDQCLISNLELLAETGTPTPTRVFALTEPPSDVDLAPGASKQIVVRAEHFGPVPATPRLVQTKLAFSLADPLASRREVPVSVTLGLPCLTVGPATLDFGTIGNTCSSGLRTLQAFNACSTDVVINSTTVSAASNEFTESSPVMAGTRVLASGAGAVNFTLEYHPQDTGLDLGMFRIAVTENGVAREYVVPLQGRGDATGSNSESFEQASSVKSDFLFVVDDSAGMAQRQNSLAQAVGLLFGPVPVPTAWDLQLGVTNTALAGPTAASAGLLHATDAGVKLVRPSTPGAEAAVQELVRVGTAGSTESCMEPATRAVTPPYITDPSRNAGLLRDGATLNIVCVTDARDQASGLPASYLNRMSQVRPPGQLRYHVVGPFLPMAPMGCAYGAANDGAHDFMVEQTGGTKDEICSTNWPLNLNQLIARAFDVQSSFQLRGRPDPMVPLTVSIDGVVVPPVDPNPMNMTRIWTYDAVKNVVVFEPLYAPEPGKTVTINYRAPCL